MSATTIREVLGVPIHGITMDEVLSRVDETIADRGRLCIGVVNAAKIVGMRRDRALHEAVLSCDVIVADGMSIVWAGRLLGHRIPERVTGIDLMLGMLRRGNDRGYRIYCLGATEEVLDKVAARLAVEFPKVVIAGRHHGYFRAEEAETVAVQIKAAAPDILFVAITSPKKEQFLCRWGHDIRVPVCHGVGGSFDVLAGMVRRAPVRWQRLGLEWLFRLGQEPRRLWRRYLVTNTVFSALVVREFLRRRRSARAPGAGREGSQRSEKQGRPAIRI
jgi:N-acetylglucosaminyldiphosphoundecaprenol N-acetyl-beta-D-mannosaminyltransferase